MSWIDMGIVPAGPVYFGDGRPTVAGETDYGEGRFPPSPRTMQGIVRTALLRAVSDLDLTPGRARQRIAELVGPPGALPAGWQMAGPWLAHWKENETGELQDVEPWLPLPRYMVRKNEELVALRPMQLNGDGAKGMRWDLPQKLVAACRDARYERGYMNAAALRVVLAGAIPRRKNKDTRENAPYFVDGNPTFVRVEPRTGLALEKSENGLSKDMAAEGMLYTLGYHRLADNAGFILRFRGNLADRKLDPAALTRGTIAVGGRNRLARLLRIASWSHDFERALEPIHLPEQAEENARYWLWTTTPAPIDEPWKPEITPNTYGGARVTMLAAAVGKLEAIGGFSIARRHGNAVRHYCPAGSAWLIAIAGGTPAERGMLARALHDSATIGPETLRAFGFGHTLLSHLPDTRF